MGAFGSLLHLLLNKSPNQQNSNQDIEARLIEEDDPDLVYFLNDDICSSFPLEEMVRDHIKS